MILLDPLPGAAPNSGILSLDLVARLLADLLPVLILVRLIYYRLYRRSDLFLTYFTFNLIIFLITHLLNQVQMSIGAAFGLFAVFSMLRYRTEGLSARDMTYLFIVIAMGLISAVNTGTWFQVLGINGLIVLLVVVLEGNWLVRRECSQVVHYDRLDLILPERRQELLHNLQVRTGLPVHRVQIEEIDFLKDAVRLCMYYYPHSNTIPHPATAAPEEITKPLAAID
jgi:hypothetical protein